MTQITIGHCGLPLPSPRQHDDGYQYHITGTTRLGDEVYSDYGGRWLKCISVGFHIQNNLRYRRPKMINKEYGHTQDGVIVTEQEARRKTFDENVGVIDRAVAWIRSNLDSFPEIPSIMCYGSSVTIVFGYISYGSKMMNAIHHVFAGKSAMKKLSGSSWTYDMEDPDSGLKFAWYVFESKRIENVETEVIL